MVEFDKLMKEGESYMEGMQKGREMAIGKYDKILIELWDKMNDIEKKVDKFIAYLISKDKKEISEGKRK